MKGLILFLTVLVVAISAGPVHKVRKRMIIKVDGDLPEIFKG